MYTVKHHTNSFGKIPEIVTFIPDFFNTNAIHKKVLEILENNTSEIQKELDKLNFIELFEMVDLIESHLLSKDIEVYKEYLKNNGGVTVNIDYGNKCSFACSHCSIEGNKNGSFVTIEEVKQYFGNFSTFDNTIKEIQFFNGGEIFERDEFDEIFRYFLEKGITTFHMISRGVNEEDFEKAQEKQKIISKKIENLKNDFPDFKLTLGISLDNFSKLNFGKIMYNTVFLYKLNKIFENKHLYFSCTHDFKNKKDTDTLINGIIHFLDQYEKLGKFNFLFPFVSSKITSRVNKIIDLGDFEYKSNYGERNHYYKNEKKGILLQFDYSPISDNGRGDIKTCSATHLKYQKQYSYSNIKQMDEDSFIETLAEKQAALYKDIGIDKIIKLIKSKRKGNFICANNMLAIKEKKEL